MLSTCVQGRMSALAGRTSVPNSPAVFLSPRHSAQRSHKHVTAAAAAAGGLVDPAGGRRRMVVTPRLDPATLRDVSQTEAFGPRGVLLAGLGEADFQAVAAWFQEMEEGFPVACCPAALLADGSAATLRQALGGSGRELPAALPAAAWEAQPDDAPAVALFSGMSGGEQVAVMEAWSDCTGLPAPTFGSATSAILDKPLRRLLADIVRQAQSRAAAAARQQGGASVAGLGNTRQQGRASGAAGGTAAGVAPSGEAALKSKLSEYVILDKQGKASTKPMDMGALKQQIQDKMAQKRAAAAAEEKAARRAAAVDDTDRLRSALKSGKGKKGGSSKGGSSSKGFGS